MDTNLSDLFAARSQMGLSLAFHIVFAVAGMAMPLLMVIAEWSWLKHKDQEAQYLAKKWSKGTAILFAVGAVSGTALSFELGLLWPRFMELAGPIIGVPFSLEGAAFFLEAIALGIYLYGWEKVSPWIHWLSGVIVLISGTLSGLFIVAANGWMNTPTGFEWVNGEAINVDPWAAAMNPSALQQGVHMVIAAFTALGFAVAGIHAQRLLKNPGIAFHQRALKIALAVGAVAALMQPISGDLLAKHVARTQPVKLAAMEGQWETEKAAPLRIGGIPFEDEEETKYSIEIPYLLSILAFADPQAEVKGLKAFPKEDRPPVAVTHFAFQIMVGLGTLLMLIGAIGLWGIWRRHSILDQPLFLKALVVCSPMGLLALEAGWVVTEVGRQPWIIHGIMRTKDAVTPLPGLAIPFIGFMILYFILGIVSVTLLKRHVFDLDQELGLDTSASSFKQDQAQKEA